MTWSFLDMQNDTCGQCFLETDYMIKGEIELLDKSALKSALGLLCSIQILPKEEFFF